MQPAQPVDWPEVFKGYNSQVDWPGAAVWRETSIAFPDAKVVHTERPEDEWWKSFSVTISKFFNRAPGMSLPPHIAEIFRTMSDWFMKGTFEDHTDRACAISAYRRNNEEVRDTIPAERLLVFNVAEGWAPLCRFLEKRRSRPRRFRELIRGTNSGRISAASPRDPRFPVLPAQNAIFAPCERVPSGKFPHRAVQGHEREVG